jgi:hypothetical protein
LNAARERAKCASSPSHSAHRIEPSHATQKKIFEPFVAAKRAKSGLASSRAVSIDTDHVEARI